MKIIKLVILFLMIGEGCFSQNNSCVDTAIVKLKHFSDFNNQMGVEFLNSYYLKNTFYFYKTRKIKKNAIATEKIYSNGDLTLCKNKSYFYFYTKSGKLVAEGNWFIEFFMGRYKDYYESGRIKSEGCYYSENKDKTWKYYSEEGKLLKQEEYDNGNLMSSTVY
ncbi:hypothetical protein BH10BAC1_BH10BAC1_16100 [soil metagenome]